MKARIMVNGNVQMIGYRARVKLIARTLNLKGLVRNLDDGKVEIYVEGEQPNIEQFFKIITGKEDFASLVITEKDIFYEQDGDYRKENAPAKFSTFNVEYGYELSNAEKEMIERSEMAIVYFSEMNEGLGSFRDETMNRFDVVDTKYGRISEKLESLWDISKNLKELVEILKVFKQPK